MGQAHEENTAMAASNDAEKEFDELVEELKKPSSGFNFDWMWNFLSHAAISVTCLAVYHAYYIEPMHEEKIPVTVDYAALSNAKLADLAEKVRLSDGETLVTAKDLEDFIAKAKYEILTQSEGAVVYVSGAVASESHDITIPVAKALGIDLNKKIEMSLPNMADEMLNQHPDNQ